MSKIDKKELEKTISYSLWGMAPKTLVYREEELNNKFCNYLIEMWKNGYTLVKA